MDGIPAFCVRSPAERFCASPWGEEEEQLAAVAMTHAGSKGILGEHRITTWIVEKGILL